MTGLMETGSLTLTPKKDEEEKKKGLIETTSYDGVTPIAKEQPSSLKLMLDDSISSLADFDPESAGLFEASQKSLGPNSQPSSEAALAAHEDALNYYRDTVIPGMAKIEGEAKEIKGRKVMNGFADYIPLIAASFAMNSADATMFINGYMQARAEKFKSKQEMEMYDLETRAKAIERTMKMHEMTANLRERAYAYGKENLSYVNAKLEEKKAEFAISKLPAIEAASNTLANNLFSYNVTGGGNFVDMSQDNVINMITEHAKKMNLVDANFKLNPKQAQHLYNIVLSTANEKSRKFMEAHLSKASKEKEADYTAISEWRKPPKLNSDRVTPYVKSVEELKKKFEKGTTTSEKLMWDNEKENITKILDTQFSIISQNAKTPLARSEFDSKIVEIASIPHSDVVMVDEVVNGKEEKRSKSLREIKIKELSDSIGSVSKFYDPTGYVSPDMVLQPLESNIREAVTAMDRYGAALRTRADFSAVANGLNHAVDAFNSNIVSFFNEFNSSGAEMAKGMENPINKEIAFRIAKDAYQHSEDYSQIAERLAFLYDGTIQSRPEFQTKLEAYGRATTSTERNRLYNELQELMVGGITSAKELPPLVNTLRNAVLTRAGDKEAAAMSKMFLSRISTGLDAINSIISLEKSSFGVKGVIEPVLSLYNGTNKDINEFVLNQTFPNSNTATRYLRILAGDY